MCSRTPLVTAVVVGIAVLAATLVAVRVTGQAPGFFTRDLKVLAAEAGARLPFYAGALSTLTCLVWAAGGALSLLAGALSRHRRWWSALGALLLALALDDAYLLHETVGPSKGVDEVWFYAVYAAVGASLLVPVVRGRRDAAVVAVLVGFGLLGLSIGADLVLDDQFLIEDGLKLVGALALLSAPVTEVLVTLRPVSEPAGLSSRA